MDKTKLIQLIEKLSLKLNKQKYFTLKQLIIVYKFILDNINVRKYEETPSIEINRGYCCIDVDVNLKNIEKSWSCKLYIKFCKKYQDETFIYESTRLVNITTNTELLYNHNQL